MKNIASYTFLALVFLFTACGDDNQEDINFGDEPANADLQTDNEADKFVKKIDEADLAFANSLYYTREDGASHEVTIFLNDSNQVVKTVESYTLSDGGSILTNVFYYNGNMKYVTREFFEEGEGENAVFVERVTYYDEKGKPKAGKLRKAPYEDQLVTQFFEPTAAKDCSDRTAVRVLNQTGEFATNFQFFVQDEHLLYLIVGENKEDGYRSSLVVQRKGPVIQKLLQDEKGMVGTPLKVEFEKLTGDMGFEFQALMNVAFVE